MSATARKAKMANLVIENRRLEELVYNQAIHIRVLTEMRNEARRWAINFYKRLERMTNERYEGCAGNGDDEMTYTREQIMQMDAEQLRMAIAKAKGWRDLFVENDLLWGTTEIANENWIGDIMLEVPHWPTSIADAWELVEEMAAADVDVNIDRLANWKLFSGEYKYQVEARKELPDKLEIFFERVFTATAPLAISRAYLLWRNEEQRESD